MSKKKSITPLKNGPFLLKEVDRLIDSTGKTFSSDKESIILCRCGQSNNKPFCDGTHAKKGWQDTNTPPQKPRKTVDYQGKDITIHDTPRVCAKVGYCTAGSPKVFESGRNPWIEPDAEPAEKVVETIRKCPSGALAYTVGGVFHDEYSSDTPEVEILKNGPLCVRGSIELESSEKPVSTEHYTLCRCGQSNNKPFCDSAHLKVGFKDEGIIKKKS